MHVVLVEPSFPVNQREFARALHGVGATVTGIGERPKESLDEGLRRWLTHFEQVPNVCDERVMIEKVRWLQARLPVDRLEAVVEAHIMPAARVREACGIPGTSVQTAFLCRDKPAMKEVLRKGGIPCAQSLGSGSREEIRQFASSVGFPLIVKPPAGAGASGTVRVDDMEALDQLQEHADGYRPLVAFEEGQVARADAQFTRHLRLGEAALLAEPPEPSPDPHRLHGRSPDRLHKVTETDCKSVDNVLDFYVISYSY